MTIKESLESMLEDESTGTDDYGKLAKQVMTSDEVPEEYRGAMANMLTTMSRDEDKHYHFLKLMVDML